MADSSPHSAPARALFFTQAKPCEEALDDLSVAYNRLADEIEETWDRNQRLIEQYEDLRASFDAMERDIESRDREWRELPSLKEQYESLRVTVENVVLPLLRDVSGAADEAGFQTFATNAHLAHETLAAKVSNPATSPKERVKAATNRLRELGESYPDVPDPAMRQE